MFKKVFPTLKKFGTQFGTYVVRNKKLALLVLIPSVGIWWLSPTKVDVKVISAVVRENYTLYAEGIGQIRPQEEYFLTLKQGGRLDRILVEEGATVKVGAPVALVDETGRRARLESALSAFGLANSDVGRLRSLYRSGAATKQELDDTQNRLAAQRADLQQAKQNLEDGMVRSPVDGVVAVLAHRVGDLIPDGGRIAIVEDRGSFQIVTRFNESIAALTEEQKSVVEVRAKEGPEDRLWVPVAVKWEILSHGLVPEDIEYRLSFSPLPEVLQGARAVQIRVRMRHVAVAALVDREALVERGGKPRLVLRSDRGILSWFDPVLDGTTGKRVLISNLPENAQIVLPDPSLSLDRAIEKHWKAVVVAR
jgi:RND family efflux transporter MFP subunit